MIKAIWNEVVLAESNDTIQVEGNHYFPPQAIKQEYFVESDTRTICPWKGEASYYNITVGNQKNQDAAWYYPNPKEAAAEIKNYVAFWKGVNVTD